MFCFFLKFLFHNKHYSNKKEDYRRYNRNTPFMLYHSKQAWQKFTKFPDTILKSRVMLYFSFLNNKSSTKADCILSLPIKQVLDRPFKISFWSQLFASLDISNKTSFLFWKKRLNRLYRLKVNNVTVQIKTYSLLDKSLYHLSFCMRPLIPIINLQTMVLVFWVLVLHKRMEE